MSRLDQLEQRIADLEADMGVQRGRPGFRASVASHPVYPAHPGLHDGPYGYGSQDR